MLKRVLCALIAVGVGLASGCSDVAQSDPKPASGKTNPKLKPAEAGGASGAAQQSTVKGD